MTGGLTPLGALTERDRAAWLDLATRSLEPNPFVEPDFVEPAARALDTDGVALLTVEEDGQLTAALPVVKERWRGVLPALATWRHLYSFLGSPLVDRERPVAALSGLFKAARRAYPRGHLVLDWLAADGPLYEAVMRARQESGLATIGQYSYERAVLERRPEGIYQRHLRSHHRREMRRLQRRLSEQLGAPLETVDRPDDPEAVRRFLELEASTWKGRDGGAMLSNGRHARFFAEICERFSRAGRLELLELGAGSKTVAMKCNLVADPGIFCFKIGHDEAFARFSPGIQLELSNIDHFHEGEAPWMDSCAAPNNQMINRLWPDRRRIATLILGRPGVRAFVARRAFRLAEVRRARSLRSNS